MPELTKTSARLGKRAKVGAKIARARSATSFWSSTWAGTADASPSTDTGAGMIFWLLDSAARSAIRTNPQMPGGICLRPGALVAPRIELDGAVRDDDVERRPDGALGELDLAPMGAHQLGRDRQPQPGAAGAGRALGGLEQMLARLGGKSGGGVVELDERH